jgi:hypothetical protein
VRTKSRGFGIFGGSKKNLVEDKDVQEGIQALAGE